MRERPHTYEIELSEEQRLLLQQLISAGKAPARQLAHARIFLTIDRNAPGPRWTDEQVAEAFEMSHSTVIRIRERFVEHGLDDASPIDMDHAPVPLPWMESKKPISLRCLAAPVLVVKRVGRCVSWLIVWWNSATPSTSATKPYARCSTKRTQAVAETMLV